MKKVLIVLSVLIFNACSPATTVNPQSSSSSGSSSTPTDSGSGSSGGSSGSGSTGSGSSGSSTPVYTHFVYVTNQGSNTIDTFGVGNNGHLDLMYASSSIATGSQPMSMLMHSNQKWLYVVNYNSAYISQYSIDASTGQLSPMTVTTVGTNLYSKYLAFDSSGYLYVESFTGSSPNVLMKYSVNSTTGELTYMTTLATSQITTLGLNMNNNTMATLGSYSYIINASLIDKYTYSPFAKTTDSITAGSQPSSMASK